jgi:hypothetical protein
LDDEALCIAAKYSRFGSGSNSAVSGFLRHGCFTPETGHLLVRLARPKSARSGREQPQRGSPLFDHLVGAQQGGYSSIPPLAVVFNLCDRRFDTRRMYDMASDEEAGRQILSIFMQHKVGASGVLRRNNFMDVRDADFQRGLNKAVENRWIKIKLRDRYTYELTEAGLAAGLNAGLPSKL